MAPLPIYGPGRLYAGNLHGQRILENAVTVDNFAGPPLVVCFYTGGVPLDTTTDGVELIQAFANSFDAPLIMLDTPSDAGLGTLTNRLTTMRHLFTMSHLATPLQVTATLGPPIFSSRFISSPCALAGPFMVAGLNDGQINIVKSAMWTWANTFNRTTQFHRWGIGMQAVSGFNRLDFRAPPDSQRAPLYKAGPNLANDLNEIAHIWRNERTTTISQMNALFAAQAMNTGINILVNPLNIPYVYLSAP